MADHQKSGVKILVARWVTRFARRCPRILARVFTELSGPAFHHMGKATALMLPCNIGGERWISIGSRVFIGPHSWLQAGGKMGSTSEGPLIQIGDDVSITGLCMITATKGIVIENGVLIARHVHISDHSHVFDDASIPILNQGVTEGKPVRIGEGSWIGHGVVICPGVSIGRGSVIGANSVVRTDIPDRCVAVGAPAKVIRRLSENSSE